MEITPAPQYDNTEALRQCLLGSAPADHLEPAEQVELIYLGIVAKLQGRSDDTAAEILTQAVLANPLQLIRSEALAALGTMAAGGQLSAARALYDLYLQHDLSAAGDLIHIRDIQIDTPEWKAAFLLMQADKDQFLAFDPHYALLNAYFDQAGAPQKARLILAAEKHSLTAWALLSRAHELRIPEDFSLLVKYFPGFSAQEEKLFFDRAQTWLCESEPQPYVELLTDLWFEYEQAQAANLILRSGHRPLDNDRKALFLFLADAWTEYEETDYEHRLLVSAYQKASPSLRKRILQQSRQSGHADWIQQVSQQNARKSLWSSELTDSDWQVVVQALTNQKRWAELWKLSTRGSAVWSKKILEVLKYAQWHPEAESENQEYQRLLTLCEQCSDNTRRSPLQHASKRFTDRATCLAMHTGTQTIALGGGAGEIFLHTIDSSDPEPAPISLGKVPGTRALHFDPSGAYLAAAGGDHQIRIIELKPRRIIKTLEGHTNLIKALAIDTTGRMMYSCGFDGSLYSWQFPSAPAPARLWQSAQELHTLAISGAGRFLLTAGADHNIRIFQLPQANLVREISAHEGSVHALAASLGGEIAVSASTSEPVLKVWNYLSGKLLNQIQIPLSLLPVTHLQLIEEDQHLVVASASGKIAIYHLSNGEEVLPAWQAHTQRVAGLLFNPFRAELISLGAEGNLIRWELKTTLLTRTPLAGLTLSALPELDQFLKHSGVASQEKCWLELIKAGILYNHRHDIVISESPAISIGEFDIQIE
ncbi:hypothetical protein ADN00_00870 [Ornatilinea apprima]|uniref:Uncharacterized protein n=1 Tax=Ornatilinea apprima TaxID=1134406 RepID=A0A0P6Y6P7_9CHLR|nr:hypothetical protein [Ornatilinea apprima]KPL81108.1 hypothetical protein ADN00_00870 [Ornatilinea apprima]